jgi:hypothetical protein
VTDRAGIVGNLTMATLQVALISRTATISVMFFVGFLALLTLEEIIA